MLDLDAHTYTFFLSGNTTNYLDSLYGFSTKRQAQGYARVVGYRVNDVAQVHTKFERFWILFDSHHQLHLNKKSELIQFHKKAKKLNISPEQFKQARVEIGCELTIFHDLGVAPYQISRWERNKSHELTGEQLQIIFRYLNDLDLDSPKGHR